MLKTDLLSSAARVLERHYNPGDDEVFALKVTISIERMKFIFDEDGELRSVRDPNSCEPECTFTAYSDETTKAIEDLLKLAVKDGIQETNELFERIREVDGHE